MDLYDLQNLISAGSAAVSVGAFVYAWLTARSKQNSAQLIKVDEVLADHEKRLLAIEGELKHLPSKDAVGELKLAISELKGTVGRLEERLVPISSTVNHIDSYLKGKD